MGTEFLQEYKCWDCNGSGIKPWYMHIHKGMCFTCRGSGKIYYPNIEYRLIQMNSSQRCLYVFIAVKREMYLDGGESCTLDRIINNEDMLAGDYPKAIGIIKNTLWGLVRAGYISMDKVNGVYYFKTTVLGEERLGNYYKQFETAS